MSHARLAPSNHRWPHCPGSVREEAAYPDSSGVHAIDGTGSHLLLEICLNTKRQDIRADEFIDQIIGMGHKDRAQGWLVGQERADRVQMALDYIARRRTEVEVLQVETEIQSNPGFYFGRDDWYGTVDVVLQGTDFIEIIDYKDGQMFVSEKNNSQFIAYAAGRLAPYLLKRSEYEGQPMQFDLENTPLKNIRMTVVQPKTNPAVRYVDLTPQELWSEAQKLAEAAAKTDDPDAPLVQGDWCTWCKHGRAGNCTAKTQVAMEGIQIMSEMNESGKTSMLEAIRSGQISPGTMTDEQISAILDAAPLITKMIEQVEEEAMTRLEAGQSVPGYRIGEGRSSRKWTDDEEVVAKKLKGMRFKKEDVYPAKIVSPAQALKFEGLTDRQKANIEKMIESVPGKKKVVRSNQVEKKPAEEMFKSVEEKPQQLSFM